VTLAAHLEQSNYLPNQKQGAVHKYDLKCFLLHSSKAPPGVLKDVHFFQGQEQTSSGFAGFDDCCTSSKISSVGPTYQVLVEMLEVGTGMRSRHPKHTRYSLSYHFVPRVVLGEAEIVATILKQPQHQLG